MEILLFWNWHALPFALLTVLVGIMTSIFVMNTLMNITAHRIEKERREREVKWTDDALNRAITWTTGRREDLQAELTERGIDLPEDDEALVEAAQQIIANERHVYTVKGNLERLEKALEDEQSKHGLHDVAKESLDTMPGFWRHTLRELRRGFSWKSTLPLIAITVWLYFPLASIESMEIKDDNVTTSLSEQFDEVRAYNAYTNNATVMVDDCPVVIQATYDYDLREVIVSDDGRIANRDYIRLEGDSYVTPCIDK